jgi:hypothetical protein
VLNGLLKVRRGRRESLWPDLTTVRLFYDWIARLEHQFDAEQTVRLGCRPYYGRGRRSLRYSGDNVLALKLDLNPTPGDIRLLVFWRDPTAAREPLRMQPHYTMALRRTALALAWTAACSTGV